MTSRSESAQHPLDVFDELLAEHGAEPAAIDASDEAHKRWRDRMEAALDWYGRMVAGE